MRPPGAGSPGVAGAGGAGLRRAHGRWWWTAHRAVQPSAGPGARAVGLGARFHTCALRTRYCGLDVVSMAPLIGLGPSFLEQLRGDGRRRRRSARRPTRSRAHTRRV